MVSNVCNHAGSSIVIKEDIESFFDFITEDHVYNIWRRLFGFSDSVSEILTMITTMNGYVKQGAPTSSYISNLALWDKESGLVEKLSSRSYAYTRHTDDITVSSKSMIDKNEKTWIISQIYGMMSSCGFRPKRNKHKIISAKHQIIIMGLNANNKCGPTLSCGERSSIRAHVFELENRSSYGSQYENGLQKSFNIVSGRVSRLTQFHKVEGESLRERLRICRKRLTEKC